MKTLLITLLLLISVTLGFSQTLTNGVYVNHGKTFEVDKKTHQFTSPALLHFSNGLIVKTYTNTDFTINSFYQEVSGMELPPRKAVFGKSDFAATIMGGYAMVTYSNDNENSTCVISTPMSDLELSKGTFYITVAENSTVVIVLDGSVKAHGDKKEETVVTAGSALVSTPVDKGMKMGVTNITRFSADSKEVLSTKDQFLFVIVDGKIVGVNIN